ncbi:MAG TPA: CHRD domain-containing protein [Thermoanaerobaculia bacterium]|nr:CHRD domain-containing protein [Thermoanaerobaculia bacterium]
MKKIAFFLFLLSLSTAALAQSYSAQLTGAAETPAGDPDGLGFAVVTIDGTTIRYTVFVQNIGAPTDAHIHIGAAGANGSVVVPFNVNTLTNGTATITQELANQINANPTGYYVNVHNAEFPGGAVRGQLARAEGDGARVAWLPVIGKVAGQAGTNFVTDMRVINNGGSVASVTLEFFPQNAAGNTAASVTRTFTVVPGEQKVLDDVMLATLGVSGGLGGVKITSDQNVLATARVINDLRAEGKGTAGFAFDAEETAETAGTLSFLSNNADYRTNIGYFNPASTPVTATFVARRASDGAVLGTNTITIPGYAMFQQAAFGLISSVPESSRGQNDFYVTWTSSAPLFVYASVTDNKTGDAVLTQ